MNLNQCRFSLQCSQCLCRHDERLLVVIFQTNCSRCLALCALGIQCFLSVGKGWGYRMNTQIHRYLRHNSSSSLHLKPAKSKFQWEKKHSAFCCYSTSTVQHWCCCTGCTFVFCFFFFLPLPPLAFPLPVEPSSKSALLKDAGRWLFSFSVFWSTVCLSVCLLALVARCWFACHRLLIYDPNRASVL